MRAAGVGPGGVRVAGGDAGGCGDDAGRRGRGVNGDGDGYMRHGVSKALCRWEKGGHLPPLTARAARTNLKRCIIFAVG